jgi:hypothetical protein
VDDAFLHDGQIDQGLIQSVARVEHLPGDHVGEMGDPVRFLEVSRVPVKLYPVRFQLLGVHSHRSFL